MIQVSEELRSQLDNLVRDGIDYEAVVSTIDKYTYSVIPDFNRESSELDEICKNVVSASSRTSDYQNMFLYKGFTSFELNSYDTMNPKRLFRNPTQEEQELGEEEYYKMYSTGIISKNFYSSPTTKDNPFFFYKMPFDVAYSEGEEYEVSGLTFIFGEDPTIYPTDIIITFKDKSGNVIEEIEDNPTSIYYSKKIKAKNPSVLELRILKMNRDGVKLRISSVLLGNQFSFKNELISIGVQRSSNPLSTELPRNSSDVRLYDFEGLFDPQNPNGIYYTLSNCEVQLYCNFKGIRNIIGIYGLDGSPQSTGREVTFQGNSLFFGKLEYSEEETFGDEFSTLEYLINNELMPAKEIEANLSLDLPVYNKTRNYSYVHDNFKDAFTKVANCIFGLYKESADGILSISSTLEAGKYPSKIKELDGKMICGEISVDTSSPIPNGIKVTLFAETTGEKVEIIGKGNFEMENDYVVGRDMVDYINQTFKWWVEGTQKYTIPYLADPTIEVGDFVSFVNKYKQTIYGVVAENNYSLPASPSSDSLVVYSIKHGKEDVNA